MGFLFLEPGFLTTVQDGGRPGYQKFGVPVGGAMDMFAFRAANMLVGNDEFEAALEMTMLGPALAFQEDAVVAVTGADLSPRLGEKPLAMWESLDVRKGDIVTFGGSRNGCRAYLAVRGGFPEIPVVLGSRSTCIRGRFGGLAGRALRRGDILDVRQGALTSRRVLPSELIPAYPRDIVLRVVLGPQDDLFTEEGLRTFLSAKYRVTPDCERMGARLDGPSIEHRGGADVISDAIPLGAVQVPGDGKPIVMMADRPTTGGYAKIATVATVDTYALAQARPGDTLRFQQVSMDESIQLLRAFDEQLRAMHKFLDESAVCLLGP